MLKLMGIFLNSFLLENGEPILLRFKNKSKKQGTQESQPETVLGGLIESAWVIEDRRPGISYWGDLCSVCPSVSERERCHLLNGGEAYSFLNSGLLLCVGSHGYEIRYSY